MMAQIKPMLLKIAKEPFVDPAWLFEPKLDGMRCLTYVSDGAARLFSRNNREITETFPSIAKQMSGQLDGIYDGEIVAHGANGAISFERLQERWMLRSARDVQIADRENPVSLFVFDLPCSHEGTIASWPLSVRKRALFEQFKPTSQCKLVEYFDDGIALFEICQQQRYEGIVAKRRDSRYVFGERSGAWKKIKFWQQDRFFVVGHKQGEGFLLSNGSKVVGTVRFGLRDEHYRFFECASIEREELSRGKKTIWYSQPASVTVRFMEWTRGGTLRAPVFNEIVASGLSV